MTAVQGWEKRLTPYISPKNQPHNTQCILTYSRYTQRELKLKFIALLKTFDIKYTEKSTN